MRVLFLSSSMGMGGADQQLLSAAEEMRRRGHEVLIVSMTTLGPMGLEARRLGIPTESLEMPRGVPDPRGLLHLARLVRTFRPDVLHSHMVYANLMARALRLFVRYPVLVSTIHNIYEGGPLLMTAYRLTNRLTDLMSIVSEAAADRFVSERTIPRELLRVIPNGIDAARFRNVGPSVRERVRAAEGLGQEFVWLAVGRFEVAKDYPNLLRAFARVRQRHPTSVLLIAGRGSLKEEAEALVRELNLDGVRFLDVRQDVPELMSASDAYVMSSAWEGMPIVLLEAAAAALPIVATAVGGNAEVVSHGKSGFLVPPRDAAALASAMLELMDLPPQERRAMGEAGREHVRSQHGLERVVDRWESMYQEVLAKKGRVPAQTVSV